VIKKVIGFVRESREELKKVTWPDREEVTSFTVVVIVSVVIVAVFLWFIDTILGSLINTVMN
jgi:preprotein translocase subunit SecE